MKERGIEEKREKVISVEGANNPNYFRLSLVEELNDES